MWEYHFLRVLLCLQTENPSSYTSRRKRGIKGILVPFLGLPASLSALGITAMNDEALSGSEYSGVSTPRCVIIVFPFPVLCFSELLQDLENCENDPVAIADCFVSKVRGCCRSLQHNTSCRVIWGNKINLLAFET